MRSSRAPLTPAVCLEIALYSRLHERLALLQLSRPINTILLYLLYRNIAVGPSAAQLFFYQVESILFLDSSARAVDPAQWESILPAMDKLWFLGISSVVAFPPSVLHLIPFRLTCFRAISPVDTNWIDLIASQPELEEIALDCEFQGDVPAPDLLPRLRAMKARPADIANFARLHRNLLDLWFFTSEPLGTSSLNACDLAKFAVSHSHLATIRISGPDLLLLFTAAPRFLSALRHIVLDEDLSWSEFPLVVDAGLGECTFVRVATTLDHSMVHLRSVFLVCSQSRRHCAHRRLLTRNDGVTFARIMAAHSTAPTLNAFRFSAHDGYAIWNNWGGEDEEILLTPPQDPTDSAAKYRPGSFEEEYAYLFF
ncbi:hypothetical protein B0H12DRAFT_1242873 [Mycena haematopus]|nr:hypothetical protein B0H12DRAFT_1242873 [Mycena haematopus]